MSDPRSNPHPSMLRNEDPPIIETVFGNVVVFFESYGWYILIGIIVLLYLKSRLKPHIHKAKESFERAVGNTNTNEADPEYVWQQQSAMEAARRRLQEEHDAQAARHLEMKKKKEEEKRQQLIAEWDKFNQNGGASSPQMANPPKPASARRIARDDYSPLMGSYGGSSYRPAPRRGGGAGGG